MSSFRAFLLFSLFATLCAAAESVAPPAGGSPGEIDRFAPVTTGCPAFQWSARAEAAGFELIVYAGEEPVERVLLREQLPAGLTGWTPAADRCLPPGEYAWSLRPLGEEGPDAWSQPLHFAVPAAPVDDLDALFVRLLARLEADPEARESLAVAIGGATARRSGRSPTTPQATGTAVFGEIAGASGETYGVRGISNSVAGAGVRADNSAGGSDLVLGAAAPALVSEGGLARSSAANIAFDFTNPGAGAMTLRVDGTDVLTTATASSHNHLGQTWTTANSPLTIQGSFAAPSWAPLVLSNSAVGGDGLAIQSAGGDGVHVTLAGENGVSAESTSAAHYGGLYFNSAAGGVGLYARSGDLLTNDVILGANNASSDDGRIASQLDYVGSDFVITSNDEVWIVLDENEDESGNLVVYNGAGSAVFTVNESGNTTATGTKSAVVETSAQGWRKLYAMESPQNWFEDFGSGRTVGGAATVVIDSLFAETVNLERPYYVFVTPLGNCPLYVAEKSATSFTVRPLAGATCDVEFDYRLAALRLGYEEVRLELFEPPDSPLTDDVPPR